MWLAGRVGVSLMDAGTVSVITGPPGAGTSTVARALAEWLEHHTIHTTRLSVEETVDAVLAAGPESLLERPVI